MYKISDSLDLETIFSHEPCKKKDRIRVVNYILMEMAQFGDKDNKRAKKPTYYILFLLGKLQLDTFKLEIAFSV